MTNLMVIITSVAVSLVANISVSIGLLIKNDVGSREYRSAIKFVKNNKDYVDQRDLIKNIKDKISQLENQINSIPQNSTYNVDDIKYLKNKIKDLNEKIDNYNSKDNTNNEDIILAISKIAKRLSELENEYKYKKDGINTVGLDDRFSKLNKEIDQLKQVSNQTNLINNRVNEIERALKILSEKYSDKTELENLILKQQNAIENLQKIVAEQQEKINSIQNKTKEIKTSPIIKPIVEPKKEVSKAIVSNNIITPNEIYIKGLISKLMNIKDYIGDWEFKKCYDGLNEILDDDNFDDCEEIMSSVHELINKYIYGSDTKVSVSEWEFLEKFIIDAGYEPVPVKAGDDITPYKAYFDRPIPADGGIPNTIKQIQLQPYVLTYIDCGEKETIKLCGKCTYYK